MKTVWTCDACGNPINDVDDGWVEWQVEPKGGHKSAFRLVHANNGGQERRSCLYNETALFKQSGHIVGDLPLSEFVDPDGLTNFLSYLSAPDAEKDELIEMIKRVHVPHYDQARPDIQSAIREGIIEPNGKPGFYTQEQLIRVIEWAATQNH